MKIKEIRKMLVEYKDVEGQCGDEYVPCDAVGAAENLWDATEQLLSENDELREELERLKHLIKKSSLIEVESTRVEQDGGRKPVVRNSGTILVHKDQETRDREQTKLLQRMAGMASDLSRERKLNEIGTNNIRAGWNALRLIREAVENYAPPGSVRCDEYTEPEPGFEAEAIVKGVQAIVAELERERKAVEELADFQVPDCPLDCDNYQGQYPERCEMQGAPGDPDGVTCRVDRAGGEERDKLCAECWARWARGEMSE